MSGGTGPLTYKVYMDLRLGSRDQFPRMKTRVTVVPGHGYGKNVIEWGNGYVVELRNAIQYGLYKIQVSAKTKREGCQETTVAWNRGEFAVSRC